MNNNYNTQYNNGYNNNYNQNGNYNKNLKRFRKPVIFILVIFFLVIATWNSFTFTVNESSQAIVTRFGKVVKVIVDKKTADVEEQIRTNPKFKDIKIREGKGLFIKVPIIDNIEKFSSRLLTYDTDTREVTTKDKKKLILDNNAQWSIVNPVLYKVTMGNERNANTRIDDILYSKLNEKIGQTEAHILISNKKYVNNMLEEVVILVNNEVKAFGIVIHDIRIKRTDLPKENSENIYNRMRTEREQKAKEYRSEGKEEAQKIRSEANKEAEIIVANANKKAKEARGEGDAEATRIYNVAYNKDPEFYEFYRTLQTYEKTLKNKTRVVIDSNSPFAKFLFGN